MATKICPGCGEPKDPEKDFSWSIKGIKRHSRCRACCALEHTEYYQRTKPECLKYKWERQVNKREEARRFVFSYLKENPCVDCGETNPMVLTFDHVRGQKKMGISQMVNQGYSLEAIQGEINKLKSVAETVT